MRIVHAGGFLGQGLRAAGHRVHALPPGDDRPLAERVAAVCPEPDLVLLELWGPARPPAGLADCRHRLAAYCVDTPLNAFWQRPLLALCDDIFVDQAAAVPALARHGLRAAWLPLCVPEADFRDPAPKEHDITFVGRVTPERAKRRNLLRLLSRHFRVNVVADVDRATMQDLFARSRVVLNENFFPGLTLRVFQGLASGSLVYTEAGGAGVETYFRDGEHLVCYTPDSLIPRLRHILDHPDRYAPLARAGQAACRQGHTDTARARQLTEALADGRAANPRRPDGLRRLREAEADDAYCRRFGLVSPRPMRLLARAIREPGRLGLAACHALGALLARTGRTGPAEALLTRAGRLRGGQGFLATARLALIELSRDRAEAAAVRCEAALAGLPARLRGQDFRPTGPGDTLRQAVLRGIARTLYALDLTLEPGFASQDGERWPERAYGFALLAWNERHTAESLELLLACARRHGLEAELLPLVETAIAEGQATDAQIAEAADLAWRRYDPDRARVISQALRRRLSQRPR